MTADVIPLVPDRTPSLEPMMQLVAGDLNHVNAVILERMQSEVALIPELAGHLIAGGGKRMRPMLTLASAALLDYPGTRHHKLAAAVEFIHTATLLHDDVVDGSGLRRGKRTANIMIAEKELAKRKKAWKPDVVPSQTPWQELQRKFVGQLASGACLDFAVNFQKIAKTKGVPRHSH